MRPSEKAQIYLEVARRAKQYEHHELSCDYYEAYTQEIGATEVPVPYTLHHITVAISAVRALRNTPENKIPIIKEIRSRTDLGLKEAKELAEAIMYNM